MKNFLKIIVPLLLIAAILFSIGWYLFEYDPAFTRDMLLQQARRLEDSGNHSAAVWFYRLAYEQSGNDDQVAIELAEQFKAIGNYTKAEYTLTKAIEDGGSVELYIALCKTFVEQDKLRDAVLMLEKVNNPQVKAQLDALRPAAPAASAAPGTYAQYISLELQASDGSLYYSTDTDYPSIRTDKYAGPIVLPSGESTIFALSVGENGLVSPLAVFHYVIDGVIEEVKFQDAAMEAALRRQLQYDETRVIYSNELRSVTEFTMPTGATTCEDLKWLPGLKNLTMEGGTFEDLDVLSQLTALESLVITDCTLDVKDLDIIGSLPNLQRLTISGCGISTIAGLENATGLTYLDLTNNTIRNISALSGMAALQELYLGSNALISLDSIASLTQLRVLDVSYNSLVTTEPVAGLMNLNKLDVSSNGLRNLDGIENLINLTDFTASYNQLLDVDVLASCTGLKTLNISHNTLLNIDVVAGLTQLEELDFSHNEVSSLPQFNKNCALRLINGDHNLLKSLDRLAGLANLEYIYMDYNESISNIDALRNCPKLVQVNVYGSKVRNVSSLTAKGIIVNYTPR